MADEAELSDPLLDEIDAELCRLDPNRRPLSASAKAAIARCVGPSDDQIRSTDELLCGLNAGWQPMSPETRAAVRAFVASAPVMTGDQARLAARLLRGSSSWRAQMAQSE